MMLAAIRRARRLNLSTRNILLASHPLAERWILVAAVLRVFRSTLLRSIRHHAFCILQAAMLAPRHWRRSISSSRAICSRKALCMVRAAHCCLETRIPATRALARRPLARDCIILAAEFSRCLRLASLSLAALRATILAWDAGDISERGRKTATTPLQLRLLEIHEAQRGVDTVLGRFHLFQGGWLKSGRILNRRDSVQVPPAV